MSDQDAYTPRVFLARHGETEWTKTGQYTGLSDLPLTSTGELQVISTGKHLVGTGKLIDPTKVAHIFVSPRQRAQKTFNLLFPDPTVTEGKTTHTEDIAEWSYGKYEGLLTKEIRAGRKDRGLDTEIEWDIWRDGCEDGESAEEVRERLDRLIGQIKDIQREHVRTRDPERMSDVVLVAHGHILRAFVKRWLNYPLVTPLPMMISPGAIAILSYKNRNIEEPAFYVGMSLPA